MELDLDWLDVVTLHRDPAFVADEVAAPSEHAMVPGRVDDHVGSVRRLLTDHVLEALDGGVDDPVGGVLGAGRFTRSRDQIRGDDSRSCPASRLRRHLADHPEADDDDELTFLHLGEAYP